MAVANSLNFSRAAESLRLTQPAVTHQIKTLEDELGVKLFARTSRSVRLTQEGMLFISYAGDILKLTGLSQARLRESQLSQPMRLGVGCRNMLHMQLLRPALRQLRREEPKLLPVLRMIPFDSLENRLQEGDVQMIFAYRDSAPKNGIYRELMRCPVVCMCAEDHPLAGEKEVTIEQLKEAGRIATCRPPICPAAVFAVQGQIVTAGMDYPIFCESQEEMQILAETGYSFSLMVDFPQVRAPGLRYIPLAEVPPLSFGAAYLPGEHGPLFRRFLHLLEETLRLPGTEEHRDPPGRAGKETPAAPDEG